MTTDCHYCDNPAEVCRGCYERARQEVNDRTNERLDLQHASVIHLHRQVADLSERAILAEEECERLKQEMNERLDSQYVALVRQQALTAQVTERLLLAEQERDRLRAQVVSLRKAIMPLARLAIVFSHYPASDEVGVFVGELRAAAKALEETAPTQPPSE